MKVLIYLTLSRGYSLITSSIAIAKKALRPIAEKYCFLLFNDCG